LHERKANAELADELRPARRAGDDQEFFEVLTVAARDSQETLWF
jgi:hypothetical protein